MWKVVNVWVGVKSCQCLRGCSVLLCRECYWFVDAAYLVTSSSEKNGKCVLYYEYWTYQVIYLVPELPIFGRHWRQGNTIDKIIEYVTDYCNITNLRISCGREIALFYRQYLGKQEEQCLRLD